MADERSNPPSWVTQRQQPRVANGNRTLRERSRAFLRAPPTIDFLLILNTISKLCMVAAMAFLWARTRPLGPIGRRVIAGITVSDFSLTNILRTLNDVDSFRFNPPPNDDVPLQTQPKTPKMTKVVIQRDAPALPSSEVETATMPQDAGERNLHPRVIVGNGDNQGIQIDAPTLPPILEFDPMMMARFTGEENNVPVLSFPEFKTVRMSQDTEERRDASVMSFKFNDGSQSSNSSQSGNVSQSGNGSQSWKTTTTLPDAEEGGLHPKGNEENDCNKFDDCSQSDSSGQSWDYLKDNKDIWGDDVSMTSLYD